VKKRQYSTGRRQDFASGRCTVGKVVLIQTANRKLYPDYELCNPPTSEETLIARLIHGRSAGHSFIHGSPVSRGNRVY